MSLSLVEDIKRLNAEIISLNQKLTWFFKDKNYSLEERWKVFAEAFEKGVYTNHSNFVQYYTLKGNEIDWFDDFNIEKYQSINLINFVDDFKEHGYDEQFNLTEEDLNDLREQILQAGYTSITFDW